MKPCEIVKYEVDKQREKRIRELKIIQRIYYPY